MTRATNAVITTVSHVANADRSSTALKAYGDIVATRDATIVVSPRAVVAVV